MLKFGLCFWGTLPLMLNILRTKQKEPLKNSKNTSNQFSVNSFEITWNLQAEFLQKLPSQHLTTHQLQLRLTPGRNTGLPWFLHPAFSESHSSLSPWGQETFRFCLLRSPATRCPCRALFTLVLSDEGRYLKALENVSPLLALGTSFPKKPDSAVLGVSGCLKA